MKKLAYLLLLTFTFSACKKDDPKSFLDGTYSGTFNILVNNNVESFPFEIILKNQRFSTQVGGIGKGFFEMRDRGRITFMDEVAYPAHLPSNNTLSGDYEFDLKVDSLKLIKILSPDLPNNASISYQYRLKKIN
ncbi:MAG: hypothetical protein EOO90_00680 [Pedobacter sp.]|nr:MAG: hypothetical protein EOO90_00680 [Pedobacter sp.]